MASSDQDWHQWLPDAHELVTRWEQLRERPVLSIADASVLAELVAQAMQQAFESGHSGAQPGQQE
jgi:hypothetical protein